MKKFWCLSIGLIFALLLPLMPSIIWAGTIANNTAQNNFSAQVQSVPSAAEKTVRAIVKKVSNLVQQPDAPFILMVRLQAKPEFIDAVVASYGEQATQAANNPGSIMYELYHDTEDSTRLVLYERWANLDAFITHETAAFTLEHIVSR